MKFPAIDFHCHLDLYSDVKNAIKISINSEAYILSVTTTPKAWRGSARLVLGAQRIKTALGFHPQVAGTRLPELELFDSLLPKTRYVGEVGLDGSPECKAYWPEQVIAFDHILRSVSMAGGRIISIHSRRAVGNVLDALSRHPNAGVPVLHWFSGSKRELKRAIDAGCWFSVGNPMLCGSRGREIVSTIPRERVITETDGPFALEGDYPVDPANTSLAVANLAAIWSTSGDEASELIFNNFRRLVSIEVGGT